MKDYIHMPVCTFGISVQSACVRAHVHPRDEMTYGRDIMMGGCPATLESSSAVQELMQMQNGKYLDQHPRIATATAIHQENLVPYAQTWCNIRISLYITKLAQIPVRDIRVA